MTQDILLRFALKPVVWVLCLSPLVELTWLFNTGGMTANPIEFLNRYLGEWALKFLLFALMMDIYIIQLITELLGQLE